MFNFLCCVFPKNVEKDTTMVIFGSAGKSLNIGALSQHIWVSILRKMDPIAFARSYRTCKRISSTVEHYKKGPKIHLRGQLVLQFEELEAKMLIKFQSNKKIFKRIYDFDEVLDSLARCSYFHLKSIWFPALNFDDGFFYLIMMHLQRTSLNCSTLSVPDNDHIDLAVEILRPKELCIVGEDFNPDNYSQKSLEFLESIQFDCRNSEEFEEMVQKILPHCRQVKVFVNNVADCQDVIRKMIENVQNKSLALNCLLIEYNLQYNRLFKLVNLVGDLQHISFEIRMSQATQTLIFFPIQQISSYLFVVSKLGKKFTFTSDLYETISFTIVNSFDQIPEIVARTADISIDTIRNHSDLGSVKEILFSRQ